MAGVPGRMWWAGDQSIWIFHLLRDLAEGSPPHHSHEAYDRPLPYLPEKHRQDLEGSKFQWGGEIRGLLILFFKNLIQQYVPFLSNRLWKKLSITWHWPVKRGATCGTRLTPQRRSWAVSSLPVPQRSILACHPVATTCQCTTVLTSHNRFGTHTDTDNRINIFSLRCIFPPTPSNLDRSTFTPQGSVGSLESVARQFQDRQAIGRQYDPYHLPIGS